MRMNRHARQRIASHHVVDDHVAVVPPARRSGEDSGAGTLAARQAVAFRRVALDDDVGNADRGIDWSETEVVRRNRNPAIECVVANHVARDQVVVIRAGVIADENAAGVVLDQVVRHGRVMNAAQMDPLAAVPSCGVAWRRRGSYSRSANTQSERPEIVATYWRPLTL